MATGTTTKSAPLAQRVDTTSAAEVDAARGGRLLQTGERLQNAHPCRGRVGRHRHGWAKCVSIIILSGNWIFQVPEVRVSPIQKSLCSDFAVGANNNLLQGNTVKC